MGNSASWITISFVGCLLAAASSAQETQLVSVTAGGTQANSDCWSESAAIVSADGRIVLFLSAADNLVPGDSNGVTDVFIRDRESGTTQRVSVSSGGMQGNAYSFHAAVSAAGRFVAFESYASNLVPGDTNGYPDAFVRDLQTGATTRVSVDSSGAEGYGVQPSISGDGRYVAFEGPSSLAPGGTNAYLNILVKDRESGATERVSVGMAGAQPNGASYNPSISANGRFVAFISQATNLVPGDTNGQEDYFVHDLESGTTERVSVASDGTQGNNYLDITNEPATPAISADGRFVEFISNASNLVLGDTNGTNDVFVHDRLTGTTERANLAWDGSQGHNLYADGSMSADGRWVAFTDQSPLVPGDTNGRYDIFVRDRQLGTTVRASIATDGSEGNHNSFGPSISADGRCVAFNSIATNLVPGDTNGGNDVFVRDRGTAGFTSLCEPGLGGVRDCPCSNPPDGPGRGCDNFGSTTGGAALSSSGEPSLAADDVVLSSARENTSALTSFWTGGVQISPPGVVHGAGVRCVSGLHRLYSGVAAGGFVSRPGMGDPSLSARSAAVGVPITAGQVRFYFAIYRDSQAAGPCGNSSSTVNLSNGVSALWAP